MSRRDLLIIDRDLAGAARTRDMLSGDSQRIDTASPEDALVRLRIHEFETVLLGASLLPAERSELWLQISQQALPPRVVCLGSSDSSKAYTHRTIGQPIELPETPEPAELAAALALRPAAASEHLQAPPAVTRLVGKSEAIADIRDMVERLAQSRSTVLIIGEAGTGKRFIARQIHGSVENRDRPFLGIDCEKVAAGAAEALLFGHGTDQDAPTAGLLARAMGGTLLLRNIGSLAQELQDRLADFLRRPQLRHGGSEKARPAPARIIATTRKPLHDAVQRQAFSARLYRQLEVAPISVPPLRERVEDIPFIIAHMTCGMRNRRGTDIRLSGSAMECLLRYHWPGNQQELQSLLLRLGAQYTHSNIEAEILPANIRSCATIRRLQDLPKSRLPLAPARRERSSNRHAARRVNRALRVSTGTANRTLAPPYTANDDLGTGLRRSPPNR